MQTGILLTSIQLQIYNMFYQMREIHRTLILEHTIQIVPNENSKLEFHSLIKKKNCIT
jgi:hypothetical protein